MRILHDFDPFLWQIHGNFGIRWYSIPYLLGFLLAFLMLQGAAGRGDVENLDEDGVYSFLIYLILGVLLGARFFHVFVFEFANYGFDPLAWIAVWRGGMAFHGGLVGAAGATWLFCSRYEVRVYALLDRIALPTAFALGLGRIANFINGEMIGTPYSGAFCVDYSQSRYLADPPEECRHPTQLYEWLKNWLILGVLWVQYRHVKPRPGTIFWTFVTLYGLIRFWLMYLRDEAVVWAGMTLSQVFSALMFVVGVSFLAWIHRDRLQGGAGPAAGAEAAG